MYYERVVRMKPKWVKPFECLAYIYEFNRINKDKAK